MNEKADTNYTVVNEKLVKSLVEKWLKLWGNQYTAILINFFTSSGKRLHSYKNQIDL